MLKPIVALSLSALMMMSAVESKATPIMIDFDAIPTAGAFSAGAEDGFAITASGPVAVNGLYATPASGRSSIHHSSPGAASFSLSRIDAGDFKLTSFMAASAFSGTKPLTLHGYLNGALVASDAFNVPTNTGFAMNAPTNLSGKLLDYLVFNMGPASGGPTNIDNVRLDTVDVPEPVSLALLGVGMLAAGVARRRKS